MVHRNKTSHKQRLSASYASALGTKINSSDYILLSIALIENNLSESTLKKIEKEMLSIKELYAHNDYENAIKKITALATRYKSELGDEYSNLIIKRSTKTVDDPSKNYSRRFFETELSKNLEHTLSPQNNYPLFNDFANLLHLKIGAINSREQVDVMLNQVAAFNDKVEAAVQLKFLSYNYKNKDRKFKGESEDVALDTVSRNTGIMVSSQPNYANNIAETNIRSRVPDRFALSENKPGFSAERKRVPMVASVSGTTFTLVALLEDYMFMNKKKSSLQKDVNILINEFIRFYIKSGYHSYEEIAAVLAEPHIQRIFKKYNVKLEGLPQDCISEAFKAAQHYTLTTKLKDIVHEDITHRSQPNYEAQKKIRAEFAMLKDSIEEVLKLESANLFGPKKICMDKLRGALKSAEEQIEKGVVTDINQIKKPLHQAMENLLKASTEKHNDQFVHKIGRFMNLSLPESKVAKAASLALMKLKPEIAILSSSDYVTNKLIDQYLRQNNKIPNATFVCIRENNAYPGQLVVDFFITDASGNPTPLSLSGKKHDSYSLHYAYDKEQGWVNLNNSSSIGGLNVLSADQKWSGTNPAAIQSLMETSTREFSQLFSQANDTSFQMIKDVQTFSYRPVVFFNDDTTSQANPSELSTTYKR